MFLEVYIWSWIHLHPPSLLRWLLKLFGLSILILGPLLALNVALIHKGLNPEKPGLMIDLGDSNDPGEVTLEENED